jgi:hypothetical protein
MKQPREKGSPSGFEYTRRANGDVVLTHRGHPAGTLRGQTASEFLAEIEGTGDDEAQHVMARYTGNYRRGNERVARRHPRNR